MRTTPPIRPPVRFRTWSQSASCYHDEIALRGNGNQTTGLHNTMVYSKGQIVEFDTGVKDCSGIPIHEGDILQFDIAGITHGPEREEGLIGEVWYCEDDACFAIGHWHEHRDADPDYRGRVATDYDWYYTFACDRVDMNTLKVIGDVHRSGELLK